MFMQNIHEKFFHILLMESLNKNKRDKIELQRIERIQRVQTSENKNKGGEFRRNRRKKTRDYPQGLKTNILIP